MKSLVFAVVLALGTGSPVVLDTPEVAEARAAFAKAFVAADKGEHANLAPVNTDMQAPAPVFDGKQIPEFYLQDIAPVAEARAAFAKAFVAADMGEHANLASVNTDIQAPAPVFDGKQIPEFYLQDVAPVAEARAAFAKAFVAADMGEHASLAPVNKDVQAPAPVFDGKQIRRSFLTDFPPVAKARAAFAKAFVDAEMGKHAILAPVNTDIQAPSPVFDGKQIPEFYLQDVAPVAEARAAFASTFMDTDMGEHAKLAPVNTAVQAPAPVFDGKQIPESFLPDVAPVAEARAAFSAAFDSAKMGGLIAMQEPAPEFKGEQVATAYLADTKDVADAKAAFMSAFHEVKQGGLAAKQAPAPLPVVTVKSVAPVAHSFATHVAPTFAIAPSAVASHAVSSPAVATHLAPAPAVATNNAPAPAVAVAKSAVAVPQVIATPAATSPLAYAQHFAYPHHAGLTHLVPQALHQPLLTHHTYLPTTHTNLLPYALTKPHPVAQAAEATLAVKSE